MKKLFLFTLVLGLLWTACVKEDQPNIPPVNEGETPTPTPNIIPVLEATTAKVADYVVGKKVKLHGNITVQNSRSYFKFSDGTLVQIFTPKFKSLSPEVSAKLNTEGQELTVIGVFTDYKKDDKAPVVREIVYQSEVDLTFGDKVTPPTPEEITSLEATTAKLTDYTTYLGKKVKLHGTVSEVQGNRSFFKLSDGTLVQIFTPKFKELSAETNEKLKTKGQELTIVGVFKDYKKNETAPVVRQIVYENETDLTFGDKVTPPTPEEITSLETSIAKLADYTAYLGKKVKLHGTVDDVQGSKSFFKLSDGTLVQIFTPKFKELSAETNEKLKTKGQEVTVVGVFTDYKKDDNTPLVREIVYQSEADLTFGDKVTPPTPSTPEEPVVLEAKDATIAADYKEGKKVKLHGITLLKNGNPYFKLKDDALVRIYGTNYAGLSQGVKDKLAQEEWELTVTGTFKTHNKEHQVVFEKEADLKFGRAPEAKPLLDLEATTATASSFIENRKAKIHGKIVVEGGKSYFKFKDNTLIEIFAPNAVLKTFTEEEQGKLKIEGQELTVTGTFVVYNQKKQIKYTQKADVVFGQTPSTPTPPTPPAIVELDVANATIATDFEEGKKVKLSGDITVKGGLSYFKFKDDNLVRIYAPNTVTLSQEAKDKLEDEGRKLTVTGTFKKHNTTYRVVYEKEADLIFGTAPVAQPTIKLEADVATTDSFVENRKAEIHGKIVLQKNKPHFKFQDNTLVEISAKKSVSISQDTKDKLAQEGYELVATGVFREINNRKHLVYNSESDLVFKAPPAPKPLLKLKTSDNLGVQFEDGRKAEIQGTTVVQGGSTYFKFKDGVLVHIYTQNWGVISGEAKTKLAQEGYELTVTGTLKEQGTDKRIVYESEADLKFGTPPAPKPLLELEASATAMSQFEENRAVKIHGRIEVKGEDAYFKFQDVDLLIYGDRKVKATFTSEEQEKLKTTGQELTVTGTFVQFKGKKEIKYTKKEDVVFGDTPATPPTPPTPPTPSGENIFDFEKVELTGSNSYDQSGTLTGNGGVTLTYHNVRTDMGGHNISGQGLILNNKGYITILFPDGVKDISFEYKTAFSPKKQRHIVVYEGDENGTTQLGEVKFKGSVHKTYTLSLNKSGSYTITIKGASNSDRFTIDNIKWTK